MYLFGTDVSALLDHLDGDPEVAWLVPQGPNLWTARLQHPGVAADRWCLWHIPSGPLPFFRPKHGQVDWIEDPWSGWENPTTGTDNLPRFGSHHGVYWLNLRTDPARQRAGSLIGLSSFEWIGNRYRVIGEPATRATENHWTLLRKWVSKTARRIPRTGPLEGPKPEIYAFPEALAAIEAGTQRASNPR